LGRISIRWAKEGIQVYWDDVLLLLFIQDDLLDGQICLSDFQGKDAQFIRVLYHMLKHSKKFPNCIWRAHYPHEYPLLYMPLNIFFFYKFALWISSFLYAYVLRSGRNVISKIYCEGYSVCNAKIEGLGSSFCDLELSSCYFFYFLFFYFLIIIFKLF
jgi:hypothetical protein